jgi:hypothetical protein
MTFARLHDHIARGHIDRAVYRETKGQSKPEPRWAKAKAHIPTPDACVTDADGKPIEETRCLTEPKQLKGKYLGAVKKPKVYFANRDWLAKNPPKPDGRDVVLPKAPKVVVASVVSPQIFATVTPRYAKGAGA